jgi:uncharacterized damage-inducible protein DinB
LAGNARQWILHGTGGAEDSRDRDSEFAAKATGNRTRAQVEAEFAETIEDVLSALGDFQPSHLGLVVCPQGYEMTALAAIFHVTEHFSYHAGQIFLLVKLHSQSSLGFYRHLDKSNKTHKERIP